MEAGIADHVWNLEEIVNLLQYIALSFHWRNGQSMRFEPALLFFVTDFKRNRCSEFVGRWFIHYQVPQWHTAKRTRKTIHPKLPAQPGAQGMRLKLKRRQPRNLSHTHDAIEPTV